MEGQSSHASVNPNSSANTSSDARTGIKCTNGDMAWEWGVWKDPTKKGIWSSMEGQSSHALVNPNSSANTSSDARTGIKCTNGDMAWEWGVWKDPTKKGNIWCTLCDKKMSGAKDHNREDKSDDDEGDNEDELRAQIDGYWLCWRLQSRLVSVHRHLETVSLSKMECPFKKQRSIEKILSQDADDYKARLHSPTKPITINLRSQFYIPIGDKKCCYEVALSRKSHSLAKEFVKGSDICRFGNSLANRLLSISLL
ncbi:hypothetical protein Tco_1419615 [Tanacetum coccineum]